VLYRLPPDPKHVLLARILFWGGALLSVGILVIAIPTLPGGLTGIRRFLFAPSSFRELAMLWAPFLVWLLGHLPTLLTAALGAFAMVTAPAFRCRQRWADTAALWIFGLFAAVILLLSARIVNVWWNGGRWERVVGLDPRLVALIYAVAAVSALLVLLRRDRAP